MPKPGIERLLFLAVGFESATVDSRELYALTERRVVKVYIYIHRTKEASYIRHETLSKNNNNNNCQNSMSVPNLRLTTVLVVTY